jgi:hypothetical protein
MTYNPMTSAETVSREELEALAEEVRERTAMKYMGNCKCGKCQLVPRSLVERVYHVLNSSALRSPSTLPTQGAGVAALRKALEEICADGKNNELTHRDFRIWAIARSELALEGAATAPPPAEPQGGEAWRVVLARMTAALEGLRPFPLVIDAVAKGLIADAKAALASPPTAQGEK